LKAHGAVARGRSEQHEIDVNVREDRPEGETGEGEESLEAERIAGRARRVRAGTVDRPHVDDQTAHAQVIHTRGPGGEESEDAVARVDFVDDHFQAVPVHAQTANVELTQAHVEVLELERRPGPRGEHPHGDAPLHRGKGERDRERADPDESDGKHPPPASMPGLDGSLPPPRNPGDHTAPLYPVLR